MIGGVQTGSDAKIITDVNSPEYAENLKKASKEFEAILLQQMFKAMRESIPKSDFFGEQQEQGIYEDMLFTELSGLSSRAEGLGVAEMLYLSLGGKESSETEGDNDEKAPVDSKNVELR